MSQTEPLLPHPDRNADGVPAADLGPDAPGTAPGFDEDEGLTGGADDAAPDESLPAGLEDRADPPFRAPDPGALGPS
ncbi:hypothetical protein [Cellulomonas endophytica]|uniref:hypothetical protein n=1 Tax=Cellulomonas endophytica TaxID=2494735 RepID=UPI0010111C83|nr:hypothetical protein [Cellulomonas endophytica]